MIKTTLAVLLAVTALASPALSAPYNTYYGTVVGASPFSSRALNANAHWAPYHRHHRWHFHRHYRHHHHRHYWR